MQTLYFVCFDLVREKLNNAMEESPSPSSGLLHDETASETLLGEEQEFDSETLLATEEGEYIQFLLEKEADAGFSRHQSSLIANNNWTKSARLDAICWILRTRASRGFQFQTAYLSVTYFDGFLSKEPVDKPWAIRLLSIACLSLAVKMEESGRPRLSQFLLEEGYEFKRKMVQRMELFVLTKLDWKMRLVTPFAYIHYFIKMFCKEETLRKNMIPRTAQLILDAMEDAKLMDHRPSAIAAASTLLALDQKLTRNALEMKVNAVNPTGFLHIEDVVSCYNRMLEIDKEKATAEPNYRGAEAFENSSVTNGSSRKRKSTSVI